MLENKFIEANIVSAENAIIGRLASIVAKRLLNGEKIVIVNADKGIISGHSRFITSKYRQRWRIKTKSNPLKGPFYPRKTDHILRRTVRGMLPFHKSRGKEAYSRLLVFKGIPDSLKDKEIEIIQESQKLNPRSSYLTLEELNSKI
ncbi:MAG: 50S ribosomal protein L13 [Candidatus Hodarchaeales archaeon]|jgi:large subunit ribosomal protein L13